MKTLSPEIADAERAVHHFKASLQELVMADILRRALIQKYVSAGDIPEDIIPKEHRQGVASNAWNALASLEIIEPVPLNLSDERFKIFGGRIKNENPRAKGRWVAAYRLKSAKLAATWAQRHNIRLSQSELTPAKVATVQLSLLEG